MQIHQLSDTLSVTGQITPEQVGAIAQSGFKSLIGNRPDCEDGACDHTLVEEAAKQAGLEWRFIPVVSGAFTQEDVETMAKALDELPKPVLAYCRSGGRCTNLFNLVQQFKSRA